MHWPRGDQDVGASVAHSTFAGTHAGRRKVIAVGEVLTHHARTVECPHRPVNTLSLSLSMHESTPKLPNTTGVRVAFQGEPGAYSELAIEQLWPNGATAVPSRTFADALTRVLSGDTAYAVLPVENAIAGPVIASHEALHAVRVHITKRDETRVDIHLCLLAVPGSSLPLVRVVRSHPMALAQSQDFFARHDWLTPEAHDAMVSRSSHLPHVVAAALASEILDPKHSKHIATLCATGFRDTTRVASGSPEMWRDIALANREALRVTVDEFVRKLQSVQAMLRTKDSEALQEFFETAKERRDNWCAQCVSPTEE